MKICKMITISTIHVKKETFNALKNNEIDIVTYRVEDTSTFGDLYGFFILTCDYNDDPDRNLPPDLVKCLEFADNLGCTWLRIDHMGEVIEELPNYHW